MQLAHFILEATKCILFDALSCGSAAFAGKGCHSGRRQNGALPGLGPGKVSYAKQSAGIAGTGGPLVAQEWDQPFLLASNFAVQRLEAFVARPTASLHAATLNPKP